MITVALLSSETKSTMNYGDVEGRREAAFLFVGPISRVFGIGCLLGSMSALPPKADIPESDWHVRFVPKADILKRRS